MLALIITILLIALAIFLVNKKFNTQLVFLFLGVIVAFVYTLITKTSMAATSCGNIYLDIFELLKETFVSTFTSTGMAMIPIYAYSVYMNKINAGEVLGELISKPIARSKNPYFVGTFITIMICGIMRIAIVSAFAIMALFLTTLYPALTKAGMSRKSAITAIFIGTCFDWGPADFVIAQMVSGIQGFDPKDYFVSASIKVVPFALLAVSLLSGFIFQAIDKKSGFKFGDDAPEATESTGTKQPKYYAIFPLLPMVFIVIFSPLFGLGVNVSVLTAVMLSVLIVLVVETIRKKTVVNCVNDLMAWFKGMGEAFGNLLTLVICIQYFAAILGKLNGFSFLINAALNAGMNGYLLLIVFGLLMFIVGLALGGGGIVGITLAPQLINISAALGIPLYAALLPMQLANGCRCINLGTSAHMSFVMKEAKTDNCMDILLRSIGPCLIMYAVAFVFSLIIL